MIHSLLALISSWVLLIIEKTGYTGIFLLMTLESANIPIPSEVVAPFSGFLAQKGVFNIWMVSIIAALGNVAGSLFSYWLGYLTRKKFFNGTVIPLENGIHTSPLKGRWEGLEKNNRRRQKIQDQVLRARAWTDKFGDWAILISRVLPVVRTFISFPLGVIKVKSLWRFTWLTFVGAFIWSYILVKIGYVLGENWSSLESYFRKFDYAILSIIIIGLVWWLWHEFLKKK